MILSGLLHDGRGCYEKLEAAGVTRGLFYSDPHGRAFDLFTYVAFGWHAPTLLPCFDEARRRGEWFDTPGNDWRAMAAWLVDLWALDMWLLDPPNPKGDAPKGMTFWAQSPEPGLSYFTWAALAAAAKVKHLAARRATIHAANEAIRDALDPAGDADELYGRADSFGGY